MYSEKKIAMILSKPISIERDDGNRYGMEESEKKGREKRYFARNQNQEISCVRSKH